MNRMKIMFFTASCLLLLSGCSENGMADPGAGTESAGQSEAENSGAQLPGETTATEQTEQKLTETELQIKKSLVRIQAGDLQGNGVIYAEETDTILIVTAGHVLAHSTGEIMVTFPDGTQAETAGTETVSSCDLAFVWVNKSQLPGEAREICLPVQTDRDVFDSLEVYEDVWMYGGGEELPVYAFVVDPWIYVEDFSQYMLLLQGNIVPGMSGGGVFTEDGIFVGILCGADDTGKVAVVPYSIVETEKP